MRALIPVTLSAIFVSSASCFASTPSAPVRRFALVIGANRGAADRVPLRYAVADAERFADILTRMGGVLPADRTVLRDPTRKELLDALATTSTRATDAQTDAPRVEVLLYFSGHADDQGLMLGREMLPYRELRDAIHSVDADLGITILDACASGAITRLKGGRTHPAFLTGAANEIKGYAFLTSSSENEAAQESERLRGSFFSHALLSGLRGAADVSGDGRVTLNEAYQFAFNETLVQTATTQAGTQHPAYDIKVAGTGEVVMTDVRQTSSSLVLGADYDGRFLVLNSKRHLVAELYKPQGRTVELGLEPGEYEVYFEQQKQLLSSSLTLADGQRRELARTELKQAERLPTRRRGLDPDEAAGADLLDGRVKIDAGWLARFSFLHWIKPTVALQLSYDQNLGLGGRGVFLGARYYVPTIGKLRPYAGAALGAVDVVQYERSQWPWTEPGCCPSGAPAYYYTFSRVETHPGGAFEVGLDLYLGRKLSVGLKSQASIVNPGASVTGERSSFDTWVSLGWTFGGRRRK